MGKLLILFVLAAPLGQTAYRIAVPWPRADCAAVAEYILARRAPSEPVAVNHWEYMYYFRHLGPAFGTLDEVDPHRGDRLWLALAGGTTEERLAMARSLSPGDWRIVERREFTLSSVFLLTRPPRSPGGGRSGPPRSRP